jgi:hypothetical protein
MTPLRKVAILFVFLIAAHPLAYSQLRNLSPYDQDRINPDQTGFILHDNGTADFLWASEWTQMTAQSHNDEAAIFVWHFKDGTKAYSRQGELVADFGKGTAYLLAQKASTLEDANGNKIQPLTKTNYPTKVELWIGTVTEAKSYSPNSMVDYLCFPSSNIEPNHTYHFSDCPQAGS